MKPKLLLKDRRTGKTTRLLETVKWLTGAIVVPDFAQKKEIERKIYGKAGYERVKIITDNGLALLDGVHWDIICVDELNLFLDKTREMLDRIQQRSKCQIVITTSFDEGFDVEFN